MQVKRNLIYALCCPVTGEVHYVGKSTRGMIRPFSHLSKSHSKLIKEWVADLKIIGHIPHIKVLELIGSNQNIDERERYWIEKYKTDGNDLLNILLMKRKQKTEHKEIEQYQDLNETNYTENIGAFVRSRRKLQGLNQYEFARKAGVGLRFLRELEQSNKLTMRMDKVNHVLNMFGCRVGVIK